MLLVSFFLPPTAISITLCPLRSHSRDSSAIHQRIFAVSILRFLL